ncbi:MULTISPECIES: glycosyltransferase [Bacteroidales]|jgi:glycosyltransferase involved in cell wall biosynthesis|uniref:Glycosyltransferase n=2 Tax=Xylanibacter rodentium TaxID=2736289 RepID=A0ABX2ARU5_9BACT|nr:MULTISPECIES: glycosyltransferase [Bacteroidales]NPE11210.1 glycosyltransferase [Prevotella sp. PJ1A]NPE13359.1 glycosyltransferase [Xylanibacter rodentium]NPE39127.1 glycosyltransferase [Prevotella sp. PCJ2]
MRVFHVITHFDVGGAERVAVNIAKSKTQGIEYHLVEVVRGEGEFSDAFIKELGESHIHYHRSCIKNNKVGIICFPFLFIYLALKWKPDVIHTHTEIPDLGIYLWHRMFRWLFPHIKYVRTIHNTELWNRWPGIGDRVERFFKLKHANIAISESTQTCYKNNYEESPPIIFNGLQKVLQKPFENIVKNKINILFAGRLEYQKGIDQLIAVITAFGNNAKYHFHVVGNGSMKEKVSQSLSVFDNVSLYDKIFGLNHYIGSFDYLFMPSNHEGLALMPIEASLAHTPSIINKCPGLKDTLPDYWPLKVENNNVDDFIKLILALEHNNHYKKYADMAYAFAKENFSIEKMQHDYENIYMRIV